MTLTREMLRPDFLGSTSADKVAGTAFGMLTYWQDLDRESQILGSAALFLKMCEAWGANPTDILQISANIIAKNQQLDRFRAMDAYIANELNYRR